MKIGDYEPKITEKGYEESLLNLEDGAVFWTVKLDKYSGFDVATQFEAEVLSRLVNIERKLDRLLRK